MQPQAVALTRSVMWRITHASLFRALEHRPVLYRIICNAVMRRSSAGLAKLDIIDFLVKDNPEVRATPSGSPVVTSTRVRLTTMCATRVAWVGYLLGHRKAACARGLVRVPHAVRR